MLLYTQNPSIIHFTTTLRNTTRWPHLLTCSYTEQLVMQSTDY